MSVEPMPSDAEFSAAAARAMGRSAVLAGCTDGDDGLARLFCSPAMAATHDRLSAWMTAAGMSVRLDAAGNLVGRRAAGDGSSRALLVGSHLDTVVNAGRYDGTLGVLLGLGLAELCHETAVELPFAVDVIGFSEEEGVRYQSPYIGSRVIAGDLPAGDPLFERLDDSGTRMADTLAGFGCDLDSIPESSYPPESVVAFVEPHIEQGPVLERKGLPLGVVQGIAGQTRAAFRFSGDTGHAGTVPMQDRRDPLPAAALLVAEVERIARACSGAMATVGRLEVLPNVANVIPEEVLVRLDLRHLDDTKRDACFVAIHRAAMAIAEERGVDCRLEWVEQQPATPCDAESVRMLADCVADTGFEPLAMTSGAGHDSVVMAGRFPTSLLFLRCGGGLSHHPDESVLEEDVEAALRVLWRLVMKRAEQESSAAERLADPA